MHVRHVIPADRDAWLAMRCELWPDDDDEHIREIDQFLARPPDNQQVFVAEVSPGKLIGMLEASIRTFVDGCTGPNVGYIEGWFVDVQHRQRGIGGQLVRAAEAWAREKGCTEMASDCAIDNTASERAHLAMGYEESFRAILFRKEL